MNKEIKIGAVIPLTLHDIKVACSEWIEREYGVKIESSRIDFTYEGDYDTQSVAGAEITLSREEIKSLLLKN